MIWFLLHPPASSVTTPTSYSICVPVSPNFQFLKQDTLSLASQLCQILSLLLGTLLTPTSSYIVLRSQLRHLFLQEAFPGAPGPPAGVGGSGVFPALSEAVCLPCDDHTVSQWLGTSLTSPTGGRPTEQCLSGRRLPPAWSAASATQMVFKK